MAITFVNVGLPDTDTSGGSGGAVTLTPPLPADVTTGDLLLVGVLVRGGSTNTISVSGSGYTQATDGVTAARINAEPGQGNNRTLEIWYKFHDGSESDPTVSVTGMANTCLGMAAMAAYRGVDTSTPVESVLTDFVNDVAATFSTDDIATDTDGAWVIDFVATTDDNALDLTTTEGFTERMGGIDYDTTTANDGAIGWADIEVATAGTVPMGIWTQTVNGNDDWAAIAIALKPASGSTPATVTPGVIGLSAVLPASSARGAARTLPAATSATLTLPVATVKGAARTLPAVTSAALTVPTATPRGAAATAPAVTSAALTIPTATAYDSGAPGNVAPDPIATSAVLPAVTVSGSATVTPDALVLSVALPQVSLAGGAIVEPGVLNLSVVIPQAQGLEGAAPTTVTPAAISAVLAMPTPSTSGGAVVDVDGLVLAAVINQAVASGQAVVEPSPVSASLTVPLATVAAGGVAAPDPVDLTVSLLGVTAVGPAVVAPDQMVVVVTIPAAQGFAPLPSTYQEGGLTVVIQSGGTSVSSGDGAISVSQVSGGLSVGEQS